MAVRTRGSASADEWGPRARYAHRLAASALQLLGGAVLGAVVAAAISEPSPHPLLVAYLLIAIVAIAVFVAGMVVSLSSDAPEGSGSDGHAAQSVQREFLAEVKALRLELEVARKPWWRRGRRAR